ncbi:class III signal peptide-containing protein [Methanobrevibacter sp. DSM 116169]|uniref:class III signal peptide-containing protein n=1 Tax=Methanobrevibacter sp. DSM 116169 TaxID=3242727 RepID=UPI0038FC0F1F
MNSILNENSGQTSAELILLIGGIIVIVIIVGSYGVNILDSINKSLKSLLESEKEFILNNI